MTPQKYDAPKGEPRLGPESAHDLEQLSKHITQWWGDAPEVFHEIVSEYVHIDLHLIPATADRPYHTIVTSGMSDRPMKLMPGHEAERYCELVMALPPTWPIRSEEIQTEDKWWPFRHLKQTARFPHVYDTRIWYCHTIANEDPPQPFYAGVPFVGGILSVPVLCPKDAWTCTISPEKKVHFFAFVPLHDAELRFAWESGSNALFEKLDGADINEVITPDRKSVV